MSSYVKLGRVRYSPVDSGQVRPGSTLSDNSPKAVPKFAPIDRALTVDIFLQREVAIDSTRFTQGGVLSTPLGNRIARGCSGYSTSSTANLIRLCPAQSLEVQKQSDVPESYEEDKEVKNTAKMSTRRRSFALSKTRHPHASERP